MVYINCRLSLKFSCNFLKAARGKNNIEIEKEGRILIFSRHVLLLTVSAAFCIKIGIVYQVLAFSSTDKYRQEQNIKYSIVKILYLAVFLCVVLLQNRIEKLENSRFVIKILTNQLEMLYNFKHMPKQQRVTLVKCKCLVPNYSDICNLYTSSLPKL